MCILYIYIYIIFFILKTLENKNVLYGILICKTKFEFNNYFDNCLTYRIVVSKEFNGKTIFSI